MSRAAGASKGVQSPVAATCSTDARWRRSFAAACSPRSLPRVIQLPREVSGGEHDFVLLSAVLSAFVDELFSANGLVREVDDEGLIDAVTAVSGSGPAYVFHFIEALTAAGIEAGLSPDMAATLAGQTVYGAASLAAHSAETPETLRRQVTSPNGTTQAGLEVLMGELTDLVTRTVEAAKVRSIELRN